MTVEQILSTHTEVEQRRYTIRLSDEEIAVRKIRVADIAVDHAEKTREFKKVQKAYNDAKKEREEENAKLCDAIKLGSEEREGDVYLVPNHDTNEMETWAMTGAEPVCVDRRRMTQSERQLHINMGVN